MEATVRFGFCALALCLGGATAALAQTEQKAARAYLSQPVASLPPRALSLSDLVQIGLAQNPAFAQAGLTIQAAGGQVRQAGLYPNPTMTVAGDEMGKDGGIIAAPFVSQEVITGGKRRLDIAIASRKYDQATLGLLKQKFVLISGVRQGFFEVLTAQQRVETLKVLEKIAKNSYDTTQRLVEAKQVAVLDLLQIQVQLNQVQAELEAAKREQTAAWRRLTAVIAAPHLAESPLLGSLESALPDYDFESSKAYLLENHPEVGMARFGIDQAQLTLRRNEVQAIPNVTLGAGYVKNNNNRADQWMFQVGVPVPVFNRNQGNVLTARADLGKSVQEVNRVQYELLGRLATAYGNYAAARERVDKYRKLILPTAQQANKIALDAYKGGQFEYLRVLQAQRTLLEANLEYVRTMGEAWRAASEISGLLLEEDLVVTPLKAAPPK